MLYVLTKNGKPVNQLDIMKQDISHHSLLQYALHFHPKYNELLTFGFTNRYSWISSFSNNTEGAALPVDNLYLPHPVYLQIQEELARTSTDGIYRLSPHLRTNKCLSVSNDSTSGNIRSLKHIVFCSKMMCTTKSSNRNVELNVKLRLLY
ncbi:unnamed protein product [Adineta ricciae]|uniref:Uncharacterized protein n=1 Tax=Adineta ricciae TaxID=249248 RepID=A0A816FGC7_ADIRI|nr:unnamed protein product [Adineta ricciae]CAF1661136.1 unnamed protein product [Adineta ricciae]